MKMLLIKEEVWDVVGGNLADGGQAVAVVANGGGHNGGGDAAAVEDPEIVRRQEKSLASIILAVEDDQVAHIQNATTGGQAWNIFREIHLRTTVGSRTRVMKRLFTLKL